MHKTILVAALSLLAAFPARAEVTAAQKYKLNSQMGQVAFETQLGTLLDSAERVNGADSTYQGAVSTVLKRVARAVYDAETNSWGSSTVNSGKHYLGVPIPRGAIITRSFIEIDKQFASPAGNGEIAFQCGPSGAGNVKAAADIDSSAAGAFLEGAATGASSAFQKIGAACDLYGVVTVNPFTQGRAIIFVEYVVGR
jgi:hypothetical protein